MIAVLHKKRDRTEFGNYRVITLVSHAGKVLLKINAARSDTNCETDGRLQEEQCGFCPYYSAMNIVAAVRSLKSLEGIQMHHHSCVLLTCRKHSTPSAVPSCGRYTVALECRLK